MTSYILNGQNLYLSRGCSDDMFIKYAKEDWSSLSGWIHTTKAHAEYIKEHAINHTEQLLKGEY